MQGENNLQHGAILRCTRRAAHVLEVMPPIHDFRHPPDGCRAGYNRPVAGGRWLKLAGYATWLVGGLVPLVEMAAGDVTGPAAPVFLAAFAIFGAGLVTFLECPSFLGRRGMATRLALIVVQSVAALAMVYVSGNGTTAAVLVVVAAEAPYVLPPQAAWPVVAVNTVLLGFIFGLRASWVQALSTAISLGGFQLFALATSYLALRERAAREDLARSHAELLATRSLLEENTRVSERVRIARDLHDTLGHHLTALSLQLDVASRLGGGQAAKHVEQAHAIAKLLLSDVREVVSQMRDSSHLDLGDAVRALAGGAGGLHIHLNMPESVDVDDAAQAQVLLRCVQEIITNAARHAAARNLWIRIERRSDGIALHARDDGRGAAEVTWGNGLTGMRERFEEHAGRVEFTSAAGRGFEVHGFMPRAEAAS
jgi:signal transduction histidine kinase